MPNNEQLFISCLMNRDPILDIGSQSSEFIDRMYQNYLVNPRSVDSSWREFFNGLIAALPTDASDELTILNAYRRYGHLWAKNNPLRINPLIEPDQLKISSFNKELISNLQKTYCGNIGIEYMDRHGLEFEKWIQERIEPTFFKINLSIEEKQMILHYLNKSELFEVFLHTKYVGQKRFSIEGAETLIPILAVLIEKGADLGVKECVLGMSHRGRLNVLANILDKSYGDIFGEFDLHYIPQTFEGSGDVKYHKGFFAEKLTSNAKKIKITLMPNPSHLESVDPVVTGFVKARQQAFNTQEILPILIHGDASLSGQGVVYETLQMKSLEGYSTGGTIHLVVNNQIGFTTLPKDGRSTLYCTDIAKTFDDIVFHVNAEDPEACIFAVSLAIEIRQQFGYDVWIDLLSYRKYGHNESDEPAFTQPLEYQTIRNKKPIRELYRDDLIGQGVLEGHLAEELEAEFKRALQEALKQKQEMIAVKKELNEIKNQSESSIPNLSVDVLRLIGQKICTVPKNFNINPKLASLMEERLKMLEDVHIKTINWGMGELLAYGSLLWEGFDVRLSGQDCCRGTFSHRHAVWVDQKEEKNYISLQHLKEGQGNFYIYNSPLSEYAVLAFEYGYSLAAQNALVLWEAQFGDFCNGAQIVIDQYLACAEQKWGKHVSLVLLLPHGYEGQGPEHSSARMERFLSLCASENMKVINPSTPAQFYHALRRQMHSKERKPLIVFTPKALLRHSACTNSLEDFSEGSFEEIMDEPEKLVNARKLVLCNGKIYYELLEERRRRQLDDVAIIRIEQLYPFKKEMLKEITEKYKAVKQFFWVQEEPENMGAWTYVRNILNDLLGQVVYVGRKESASSATGFYSVHKKEDEQIFNIIFSN